MTGRAGLAIALAAGLGAAWLTDRALRIETVPAPAVPEPAAAPARTPLALRLVDAGGVGIPARPEGWGRDYSHNTRVFHELIRTGPPYVDETAFREVRADWERYLDRMAAYGNNGVVVPAFLELVNFDRLDGGDAVYAADSPDRARHRVLQERFGALFASAQARGFQVYLKTDMLALTAPLLAHLRSLPGGMDPRRPELWRVYRAGLLELFARYPSLGGVVVRVGEAGPLFNRPGWPYWSEFAVADRASLRTMLRELLPAFEANGKRMVLRTWSVGPGELGSLHTSPATYDSVLGDVDSPALIVSTKYLQGDFFGFLPVNPTLRAGRQQRIVEFQARREFEGFGAFPNYVALEHQRALRDLLARNPRIVGAWTWTQDGGPLRAGPLSLYPLHGAWEWIDANVYATSRLLREPDADLRAVAREWTAREVGDDPEVVDVVSGILLRSRQAVEDGFYVRPFAERRLRMGKVEVPPLLWVMEWDVVGGWSSVLGTMYRALPDVEAAVGQGFAAAAAVGDSRRALERVAPKLRPELYAELHGSLRYEESLLTTLAWYRSAALAHCVYLDTGRPDALARWHDGAAAYAAARAAHRAAYEGDLDFPAFDFAPADHALVLQERSLRLAWLARGLLALLALLCALAWRRLASPGERLARTLRVGLTGGGDLRDGRPAAFALVLAAAVGLTAGATTSFASPRLTLALLLLPATFGVALHLLWRDGAGRGSPVPAAMAPLLAVVAVLLAAMSVRGPAHLWFLFWSDRAARAGLVTLVVATLVWQGLALVRAGARVTGRRSAGVGTVLAATGAMLCALSLLLPRTAELLGALHDPLALLPTTFAVVQGIVTYLGVPATLWLPPAALGIALLIGGRLLARAPRPPAARPEPSRPLAWLRRAARNARQA